MKTLFQSEEAAGILERLSKLQPGSKPLWGKMNVSQMLAHCQVPLKVALGTHQLRRSLIGILFGGIAKKQMLSDAPFKKHLPTDPSFLIKDERVFEKEKKDLESLIRHFASTDASSVAARRHPFFGSMTPDEWGKLQWKHLDHHFRQFGV